MFVIYVSASFCVHQIARAGKSSPSTNTTKSRTLRAKQKKKKSPKVSANDLDHHRPSLSNPSACPKSRSVTIVLRVDPAAGRHDPDHVHHQLLSSSIRRHPPNKHLHHRSVAENRGSIRDELLDLLVRLRLVIRRHRRRSGIDLNERIGTGKGIDIQIGVVGIASGKPRYHHRQAFCK